MGECCSYTGTCRACLGSGKFWFTTRNESNCCSSAPNQCGFSIAKLAETMKDCHDPSVHTTLMITGVVLGGFFLLAIIVIVLLGKRGACPSFLRFFNRRHHGDDIDSMIPMVTYRRSASVYSLDLVEANM